MDDSGAAYTFVMIGILLIVAAIVWSFLMLGLNPVVDIHNDYVKQGTVSVQSHYLATAAVAFLLGIPGITLIGLWILAVNRSNEVAQGGNLWG